MKTANVAEAVKSEHAVALLKQMYGENRAEENAARSSSFTSCTLYFASFFTSVSFSA